MKAIVKRFGETGLHITLSKKMFVEGDTVEIIKKGELEKLIERIVDKKIEKMMNKE